MYASLLHYSELTVPPLTLQVWDVVAATPTYSHTMNGFAQCCKYNPAGKCSTGVV